MTKIAGNILELIGNTPLVKLNKLNGSKAEVLLKLDSILCPVSRTASDSP